MEGTTQKRNYLFWFVIIIILVGITIYNIYKYGAQGIYVVINGVISMGIWVLVIGLVLYVLYLVIFWEKRVNALTEVQKQIVDESKISRPDNLKNIYLSGDKNHRPKYIGKIIGYSHRQNYNIKGGKYEFEDIFLVKPAKKGFFAPILEIFRKSIIIRCPEDLHNTLHKTVEIKSISLVKHGMYYYPDTVHLNFDSIDHTIYYECERFLQLDLIGVLHPIIKRGVGLSETDIKELEPKKVLDIYGDLKDKKGQ